MTIIIISLTIIIIGIIIVMSVIRKVIIYKNKENEEYKEPTEQDKMYRAVTTLAYLIIAIIIIAVIVKVLFWAGLITAIKNH